MSKYSILVWGLIILGIAGIVLAIFAIVTNNSGTQSNPANLITPVSDLDWVRGVKDAKVVLVEYSDFQCPACAYYYFQVKKLETDFNGKLKVVYRYFPLEQIHKYARLSARVAESAGKQGKFWEMHDLLFNNQEAWTNSPDATPLFASYANELNLDMNKFVQDINSFDIDNKINSDYEDGAKQGILGTPTFFVNGKKMGNIGSYEEFKKIIGIEINK
ncbi:disulfide bond formation protein DsbA [Candidatus Wolfebacteria bacterium CG10_big_fil_rev_8_21_14_0_10_31_9]|uniref:Disulfide bond formation protein DsbA n=1 Tax=Candidatus Wolfebacteria bacterium CG10_big_fil_rev_8_21_14_0_10_31_9 TaxID=1975070 RepID=A0A2H0RC74_9BACT|nr:MAG: disulfide bond formation protein DsbA [Candidatus Wolfebacteria bacterium CG10_big_fil_rev_8_21_14_0_10_31_9]